MVEVLRRARTTLLADALAQAEAGAEAFRMAGVVRRRQERAAQGSGDKFAFVTLSDPTGEYEVLFPPESLRRCRDLLEPGRPVLIKVRAKAQGRRGALLRRRGRAPGPGHRERGRRPARALSPAAPTWRR